MPDPRPPQRIDQVRPGYYRIRRVKNGPWIAAEIIITNGMVFATEDNVPSFEGLQLTELANMIVEAVMGGDAFRHPVLRTLWFGVPIDAAEYKHLLALAAWARANAPSHPAANPDRPISMHTIPITDIF
jgi:hypothetical protein